MSRFGNENGWAECPGLGEEKSELNEKVCDGKSLS